MYLSDLHFIYLQLIRSTLRRVLCDIIQECLLEKHKIKTQFTISHGYVWFTVLVLNNVVWSLFAFRWGTQHRNPLQQLVTMSEVTYFITRVYVGTCASHT